MLTWLGSVFGTTLALACVQLVIDTSYRAGIVLLPPAPAAGRPRPPLAVRARRWPPAPRSVAASSAPSAPPSSPSAST